MEKNSEIVNVQTLPLVAGFNWSVGFMMQRFITALARKELLAARCPTCAYTYVPPRSRCGNCHGPIEEKSLIPLSGKGTVVGYTTAYVRLDGEGDFQELEEPTILGAIKFEDADSTVFLPVEGVTPEDVQEGMKVHVKWKKDPKGELADIQCVTPLLP